jgi:SAM-dependent methyltransferase
MAPFKNAYYSHEHSLEVLNLLYAYDSFLDSITTVADMGCGTGLDMEWWATLMTRDNPPEPHNYTCYAVDTAVYQVENQILEANKNITPLEADFETVTLPTKADLVWCHDAFQYAKNPLNCLKNWRSNMNTDGMLVITVPQTTYFYNNKLTISSQNYQYYNYNILSLMYLLALSGFDCRDAYFYRKENSPWLYAAVYCSNVDPLPGHASWQDLADRKLVNDSIIASINKYGHARLDDVVVQWLDKDNYLIKS